MNAAYAVAITITALALFHLVPTVRAWRFARARDLPVGFGALFAMRLRRTDAMLIAQALAAAREVGLELDVRRLEAHALAGGRVKTVVEALVNARRQGIEFSYDDAVAMDLKTLPDGAP